MRFSAFVILYIISMCKQKDQTLLCTLLWVRITLDFSRDQSQRVNLKLNLFTVIYIYKYICRYKNTQIILTKEFRYNLPNGSNHSVQVRR